MNPRANGQAERMIRTIKSGLRKIQAESPDCKWWEVYPDVLRGMRCMNTRATGYSPYFLVFKHEPALPLVNALYPTPLEDVEEIGDELPKAVTYWKGVYE